MCGIPCRELQVIRRNQWGHCELWMSVRHEAPVSHQRGVEFYGPAGAQIHLHQHGPMRKGWIYYFCITERLEMIFIQLNTHFNEEVGPSHNLRCECFGSKNVKLLCSFLLCIWLHLETFKNTQAMTQLFPQHLTFPPYSLRTSTPTVL